MRSLTSKEISLKETICPECGRRFNSCKSEEIPRCFYCELKQCPHPDDPDYRDVAAARISSGTYTKAQEDIYWKSVVEEDPMPQFPGFPEEFDLPKKEMKIKLLPLTTFPWSGTVEEFEEGLKEWFGSFLSVSKVEVVSDDRGDTIVLTIPDFIERPESLPMLGLNLKYVQRFFASIAEDLVKRTGTEVRWIIQFSRYPQFDFEVGGY